MNRNFQHLNGLERNFANDAGNAVYCDDHIYVSCGNRQQKREDV